MDFYPFNLVMAAAVASAMIFFGSLPIRLISARVFTRQVLGAGFAWIAVGILSPVAIIHYHILLGLLCFFAWSKLRQDHALSGKLWLCVASGLGISLGVVLILAVTPAAWPVGSSQNWWLLLASIYLGGAVIGLAYALYIFTRPEATQAGIPVETVHRFAGLLFGLILIRAAVSLLIFLIVPVIHPGRSPHVPFLSDFSAPVAAGFFWAGSIIVLPLLGYVVMRQCRSPRPSTSAASLIALGLVGFVTEILMRLASPL